MTEEPIAPEILVPRLGESLVERGCIAPADLDRALAEQARLRQNGSQVLIGQVLLEMNLVDRAVLDRVVTEQILRLRSALQDANAQLEQRVHQRTSELQSALNKLAEINQLKSNIIANVSHELRTPLTHIRGYVSLLLSQALGPLEEQQRSALQVVNRATERLENQIDDLIQFSLSSKGEITLRLDTVDLSKIGWSAYQRSLTKANERKVELVHALPEGLTLVRADEEKLTWALLHIIDNAIKFTPEGGLVSVRIAVDETLATLCVEDNGIGIPPARIEEIFEPFHQLDSSAARRYGGTGVGLAIVKQIIEAHGSEIRVVSQEGQGTRIEFILPIIAASNQEGGENLETRR